MQIDNTVGYWLIQVQRSLMDAFADTLRAYCLTRGKRYIVTPPQWGILALLYGEDSQTIGTLAQKYNVDVPTVTGLVTRIEKIGLVERIHDHEDRRVVKVCLTVEGKEITSSLIPVIRDFNRKIMPGEDQQSFIHQLQEINHQVMTDFPRLAKTTDLKTAQAWLEEKAPALPNYNQRPAK